jgi:hypothetical protein
MHSTSNSSAQVGGAVGAILSAVRGQSVRIPVPSY